MYQHNKYSYSSFHRKRFLPKRSVIMRTLKDDTRPWSNSYPWEFLAQESLNTSMSMMFTHHYNEIESELHQNRSLYALWLAAISSTCEDGFCPTLCSDAIILCDLVMITRSFSLVATWSKNARERFRPYRRFKVPQF